MSTFVPARSLGDGAPATAPSLMRQLWRRPLLVMCVVYLGLVVAVSIFAPIFLPGVMHEEAGNLAQTLQGPSLNHLLGTDSLGRDVLDQLLVGTRVTMEGVAECCVVAVLIGVPMGLLAGYAGGWVDRTIGWITDLTFAMPSIAIILVVLSVFGESEFAGMVTLGVLSAPWLARVVRAVTLPVKEELYIAAARVSGLSRSYIVTRYVFPRVLGAVVVQTSLLAAGALLAQTGLAYLGLIVTVPAPSWGGMVSDGISNLLRQPWLIWPPGFAMVATTVAFGLLGDAVRDVHADRWTATQVTGRRRRARAAVPVTHEAVTGGPSDDTPTDQLLTVEGLTISAPSAVGPVHLVEDVSFSVAAGEIVGIVGESGCGKTVTCMSVLGLLPGKVDITAGRITFAGQDLTLMSETELAGVRGSKIGLISQEPMVSLNPAFRVGWQLALSVRIHHRVSRNEANARAIELLRMVQLPEPELVARRYPHELSGGMAQRVAIARALAGEPDLLLADEPTTALDVTVQADILDLLRDLRTQRSMAILLVTHDWGVIADVCERTLVMYAGQIVEEAPIGPIFHEPLHPYTAALLAANPHQIYGGEELPTIPGAVPQPGEWPAGCHFHPRCSHATHGCREQLIALEHPQPSRTTRCIHYDQLQGAGIGPRHVGEALLDAE